MTSQSSGDEEFPTRSARSEKRVGVIRHLLGVLRRLHFAPINALSKAQAFCCNRVRRFTIAGSYGELVPLMKKINAAEEKADV